MRVHDWPELLFEPLETHTNTPPSSVTASLARQRRAPGRATFSNKHHESLPKCPRCRHRHRARSSAKHGLGDGFGRGGGARAVLVLIKGHCPWAGPVGNACLIPNSQVVQSCAVEREKQGFSLPESRKSQALAGPTLLSTLPGLDLSTDATILGTVLRTRQREKRGEMLSPDDGFI